MHDAPRAVQLAQRAAELTRSQRPDVLDTLAVAYAAAGRFPEALETAGRALAAAQDAGQSSLAGEIEARRRLYEAGQPYRAPAATRPGAGP